MGQVVCTATHPIDLEDGRSLAPGESAADVDTESEYTRDLVVDGLVAVTDGPVPRKRASAHRDDTESEESN